MKNRTRRIIPCALIVGGVIGLSAFVCLTHRPLDLTIVTGPPGGTYLPLGQQFATILQNADDSNMLSVTATNSNGSVENIRSLAAGDSDLAFVVKPALYEASVREALKETRVLGNLYTDVLQVLVRNEHPGETLADLLTGGIAGKMSVFTGIADSGAKRVAEAVLSSAGISPDDYASPVCTDLDDVVTKLTNGVLDVSFFVAGTRDARVAEAMASRTCRLMDLRVDFEHLKGVKGLKIDEEIPAGRYANQRRAVKTIGADVLLLCRKGVPRRVGEDVLRCLADNVGELLLPHASVEDIGDFTELLTIDENALPPTVAPHRGYRDFASWREHDALWILTGTLNGRYYRIGKVIQGLLTPYNIPSLVIPTQGSLDNARLLKERDDGRTLAIIQYDVALASQPGVDYAVIYGTDVERSGFPDVHRVPELCRIAVLHQEKVHAFTRKNRLDRFLPESQASARALLGLEALLEEGGTVCLGPEDSGAYPVTRAILDHYTIRPHVPAVHLSVPQMISSLYAGAHQDKKEVATGSDTRRGLSIVDPAEGGQIDIAFFVSDVPSTLLEAVLNDPNSRLLSIKPQIIAQLVRGPAFKPSTIEPGIYGCLPDEREPIQTLATDAVLVTTLGTKADIHRITKAVFDGEAFLGIPNGKERMAEELPSLPLHPDSKAYYQREKLRPAERTLAGQLFEWLSTTWRTLTILVIVCGTLVALLGLKRDRTSNRIGRRIVGVSVESSESASVQKLLDIRRRLPRFVRRRWWSPRDELDKPRWRYLNILIDDRIRRAQENLTRRIAREIHSITQDQDLGLPERTACLRSLERTVRMNFENGELDALHLDVLLKLLREAHESDT